MCGIVGLFTKNPALEGRLGEHVSAMLVEMSGRGPDSAGVAVYRNPTPGAAVKLVLFHPDPGFAWGVLAEALGRELGGPVEVAEIRASHAVLVVPGGLDRARPWLERHHSAVRLMSAGGAGSRRASGDRLTVVRSQRDTFIP